MDEEKEYPIIRERVWISKEEDKKLFPDTNTRKGKWEYQCYVCGIKVKGEGEVKQCDCMSPWGGMNG